MTTIQFDPWTELARRPHIVFARRPLPEGLRAVYGRRGDRAAIVVDPSLDDRQARCALAHELVHDERWRSIPGVDAPDAEVTAEEEIVDDEAVRRLVPAEQLLQLVCDTFDVDERTALRALTLEGVR